MTETIPKSLADFKASFQKSDRIHFNNAGIAPLSLPGKAAAIDCATRMTLGGTALPSLFEDYRAARKTFASLVGAKSENTVMVHTCSVAISQVALGMPLGAGEEIVTLDQEYPSNAYPWHRAADRAGARVNVIPSSADLELNIDRIVQAIGPRTRAVALSWVQYQSGVFCPLERIARACQEHDAKLIVDAVQGIGVLPFDLEEMAVDAVCVGTHKWLTGPMGHGFLAFKDEAFRDAVEPLSYGALSYGTPDEHTDPTRELKHHAKRFEPGNPLMFGALSGAASAQNILDVGVEIIGAEARRLALRLREGLTSMNYRVLGEGERKSPIVTFVGQAQDRLSEALDAQDVAHATRCEGIRLAPHAFNTDAEVDRVLGFLDESRLRP